MFSAILGAVLSWAVVDSTPAHAWVDNYNQAIADVRRADKPLFIVIDRGSSAVGKMIAEGPYLSAEVEGALAADYVRLFIDTETDAGKKLADQFDAAELPRVVIIDRSGDWQVYRRSGTHTSNDVLTQLARQRRAKLTSTSDGSFSETRGTTAQSSSWSPVLCKT